MNLRAVIINYNDSLNTINFINSIINYHILKEVIVVDNCSTDDSIKNFKNFTHDKFHLILNPVNSGYGEGINIAARYLLNKDENSLLMVCNNDVIINNEDDIVKLVNAFDKDTAITAPVIEEQGVTYYGFKIASVSAEIKMSLPFIYKKMEDKYRYYKTYQEVVDCVKGCLFIISLKALQNVNFFDPMFFLYYEENVIGYKLKQFGYISKVVKDVRVIHNHSVMIDKSINKINKYKILKKSHRLYVKKYLKASRLQMFILKLVEDIFLLGIIIKNKIKGVKK